MDFDVVDSEYLFFDFERQWNMNHDVATFNRVGDILVFNQSLWYTPYGGLYKSMCDYLGYEIPLSPPRTKNSNYIIVIYKRYE